MFGVTHIVHCCTKKMVGCAFYDPPVTTHFPLCDVSVKENSFWTILFWFVAQHKYQLNWTFYPRTIFSILDRTRYHRMPLYQINILNYDILQWCFRLCNWSSWWCMLPWIDIVENYFFVLFALIYFYQVVLYSPFFIHVYLTVSNLKCGGHQLGIVSSVRHFTNMV